jgi:hypothetical protein
MNNRDEIMTLIVIVVLTILIAIGIAEIIENFS